MLKIKKSGGIAFYVLYFFVENKFLIVEPEVVENFMIEDISITYLNIKKYSKEVELTFPGILDFIPLISY
nr:Holliday junction resolvase RecU [Mycoplasmopsis anatis]